MNVRRYSDSRNDGELHEKEQDEGDSRRAPYPSLEHEHEGGTREPEPEPEP